MSDNKTTGWLLRLIRFVRLDFADQARREVKAREDAAARMPAFLTLEQHNARLAKAGIPPREREMN